MWQMSLPLSQKDLCSSHGLSLAKTLNMEYFALSIGAQFLETDEGFWYECFSFGAPTWDDKGS